MPGLPPPDSTPKFQQVPPEGDPKTKSRALSYPICGVVGISNFLRGGQLGAGFGLVYGCFEAVQSGMWREPRLFAGHVAGRSLGNALR